MHKKLIAAALGLALIFGGALIMPGPKVEAASCKTVTSASARIFIYSTYYSVGLTWNHAGWGSQQYTVERSDDNGGSWYQVRGPSTSKTFTLSGIGALDEAVVLRVSTYGCDTAGPVIEYDAPGSPVSGVIYSNGPIPLL